MSSDDADLGQASRDDIAFEEPFPPEAFIAVAEAIGLAPEPDTLSSLRHALLAEFRYFIERCPGTKLSRDDRIAWWKETRDAANTLNGLLGPGGALLLLPRKLRGPELLGSQFRATLGALADEAEAQIAKLSASRGQEGRPAKTAFRQFVTDLIRVYERAIGEPVREPDWKDFYPFAKAACRCLRAGVPAVANELPRSPNAFRDTAREVWVSRQQRKNPPTRRSNKSALPALR